MFREVFSPDICVIRSKPTKIMVANRNDKLEENGIVSITFDDDKIKCHTNRNSSIDKNDIIVEI